MVQVASSIKVFCRPHRMESRCVKGMAQQIYNVNKSHFLCDIFLSHKRKKIYLTKFADNVRVLKKITL